MRLLSLIFSIVHIVPDAAIRKFFLNEGIVSSLDRRADGRIGRMRAPAMPMEPCRRDESGVIRAPWMGRRTRSRREETP